MGTQIENSINSLRGALFKTLFEVRNKDRKPDEAIAISKIANQIISTYKTEIEAVKTVNDLKHNNLTYAKNLSILEQKNVEVIQ